VSVMEGLLMPVRDDFYLLDSQHVREVARAPQAVPVPMAPSWVRGLINIRGEIVPLLDTGALLGLGEHHEAEFAVVVNTSSGVAALACTAMPEFVTVTDDLGASDLNGGTQRLGVGDRLVVRLDLEAIVTTARGKAAVSTAAVR